MKLKGIKGVKVSNEKVYLKKGILGWAVIHPIKTDGKINWKNLIAGGSWIKLIILGFIIFVIFGLISEYVSMLELLNKCLELNTFKIII